MNGRLNNVVCGNADVRTVGTTLLLHILAAAKEIERTRYLHEKL